LQHCHSRPTQDHAAPDLLIAIERRANLQFELRALRRTGVRVQRRMPLNDTAPYSSDNDVVRAFAVDRTRNRPETTSDAE